MPALALGVFFAALAVAQPGSVRVEWDAPPQCPSRDEVHAAIDALVGGPVDVRASGYLLVEARVVRDDERWTMTLRIETASGARTRELMAPSCDELAEIAAVVAASTVGSPGGPDTEPQAEVSSTPKTREEHKAAPEAPQRDASVTEVPPRSDPRTRPSMPTHGEIIIGGAFGLGIVPGPTGGISGAGALVWPHARWELGATGWAPRTVSLSGADARAEIGVWSIESRGCGVPTVRWASFPLCAGFELGAMYGRGRGLETTHRRTLPWFAFEGSATATARLAPHVAVFLGARLIVPVLRPGFTLDGEVVHRAGVVAFAAVLGFEARWGIRPRARRSSASLFDSTQLFTRISNAPSKTERD